MYPCSAAVCSVHAGSYRCGRPIIATRSARSASRIEFTCRPAKALAPEEILLLPDGVDDYRPPGNWPLSSPWRSGYGHGTLLSPPRTQPLPGGPRHCRRPCGPVSRRVSPGNGPQPHSGVVAAGGEDLAVWAERHAPDMVGVAGEGRAEGAPTSDVP